MAKSMTFNEAIERYEGLATAGLTIDIAIQEALDRIYEMGRYQGTTVEIELVEDDFIYDEDSESYFLFFDEEGYDGVIGFRNAHQGWSIMGHEALYKNGVNAGDKAFIDFGTVEVAGEQKRKYRAPLGWAFGYGKYYALIKKEAPELQNDDLIPIQSVGAFKCAILAVCYEYVDDEARSELNWAKFEGLMAKTERQASGPKKYFVGMDSSLRRRPNQFM